MAPNPPPARRRTHGLYEPHPIDHGHESRAGACGSDSMAVVLHAEREAYVNHAVEPAMLCVKGCVQRASSECPPEMRGPERAMPLHPMAPSAISGQHNTIFSEGVPSHTSIWLAFLSGLDEEVGGAAN
jgi:hypothetical protein